MTQKFLRRVRAYKELLRKRIRARKGMAFKMKLARPVAKEFAAYLGDCHSGAAVSNPARDIRELISAGPKFDAEFAFLYHGQTCSQFIEDYNEKYLAALVESGDEFVVLPDDPRADFGQARLCFVKCHEFPFRPRSLWLGCRWRDQRAKGTRRQPRLSFSIWFTSGLD